MTHYNDYMSHHSQRVLILLILIFISSTPLLQNKSLQRYLFMLNLAHNKVLTLNERISIVKLYLKNNENASEVCRQFTQLHIGNSAVTQATVIRINKNFTNTGSVAHLPRTGRLKTGRSEDNVGRVWDAKLRKLQQHRLEDSQLSWALSMHLCIEF